MNKDLTQASLKKHLLLLFVLILGACTQPNNMISNAQTTQWDEEA